MEACLPGCWRQRWASNRRTRVVMLMGDVAIGAFNSIARRRTGKRLIPSGPTWKVRQGGGYRFEGKRVFPSLPSDREELPDRALQEGDDRRRPEGCAGLCWRGEGRRAWGVACLSSPNVAAA